MFWSKGPDKPPNSEDKAKSTTSSPTSATGIKSFDENKLPAPRALPEKMKKIIDKDEKEENMYDELVDGYAPDSTQFNIRYAAYANRIRTVLSSAHRYVAYTSDIGESFRPVAHRNLVRTAYGISWMYILGDVSYEGYKSYLRNQRVLNPTLELTDRQIKISGLEKQPDPATVGQVPAGKVPPLEDYRTVMVQRAIFQSIASMGLPAFTIHSIVKYSGRSMKDMKSKVIRTWAPIGLGLAIVPFLPMLYDKPVEDAVEWMFHKGFEAYGGKSYVGDSPVTGREKELIQRPKDP